MKLSASIVGYSVNKGGNKETQFLWAYSHGKPAKAEQPPSGGSLFGFKPAPSVPDMGSGVEIGQSRIFERIKPNNPLRVSGNGIPMVKPQDPGDSFALYVAAFDDDQEWRDWAQKIDDVRNGPLVKSALGVVLQGAYAPVEPIIGVIVGAFKNKPDDFFVDGMHSGFRETYFGLMPRDDDAEEQARFADLGAMDPWRVTRKYSNDKGTITVLYELIPEDEA